MNTLSEYDGEPFVIQGCDAFSEALDGASLFLYNDIRQLSGKDRE